MFADARELPYAMLTNQTSGAACAREQTEMPRQFFVHTEEGGCCTVTEEGFEMSQIFPDILQAVAYVRRQRGTDSVLMTVFDEARNPKFTRVISS